MGGALRRSGYDGQDEPVDMAVAPDGSKVYVTGSSDGVVHGIDTQEDFATPAYDSVTGGRLGVRRFHGPRGEARELAAAVEASPNGSQIVVTGVRTCPEGPNAYLTIAYAA